LQSVKLNKQRNDQNIAEDEFLFSLGQSTFKQMVLINGKKVQMIFDTGAEVSIINERVYNGLGGKEVIPLKMERQEIKAYGNIPIEILGEASLTVEDNNCKRVLPALVTQETHPCIYGCNWIKELRPSFSINAVKSLAVSLVLKDNCKPIFCRPRTIAFGIRSKVEEELKRLVNEGVLVKVQESTWATPIVPVIKPNGSNRLCGDYKVTLNPSLKDMMSTTRPLEDIVNSFSGSRWFTELDVRHAYHQLPLDTDSSLLTTLSTPFGLYRHSYLPFDIKTAPALFQAQSSLCWLK